MPKSVGVSANINLFLTAVDENTPAALSYGGGFNLDFNFTRRFGIRYAKFDNTVESKIHSVVYNESIKFKNDVTIDMVYLLIRSPNPFTIYQLKNHGEPYMYIGIGRGKHNPRLNINDAGLQRLDSYSQFNDSYSDEFDILAFGGNLEFYNKNNFNAGIDMGLMLTDNKYITIDVEDPFPHNSTSDFSLYINLFLSYSFGKNNLPLVKALY